MGEAEHKNGDVTSLVEPVSPAAPLSPAATPGGTVQWAPKTIYEEPHETYAMSCGCVNNWRSMGPGVVADWLKENKQEFLAGLTVALTVVPTAVAFAFLAGVDPSIGLTGSWIIGLVLALLGGRTGMVYCNAGAVAVVVLDLVEEEGVEYMFYAFMLAGIITVVLGFLKVGKLLRLIPASAMIGFVNGLAIVIFMAQLKNFQVTHDDGSHSRRRLSGGGGLGSFDVLNNGAEWISGEELWWMLANVLLTMATMLAMPKVTSVIPSALGGIVVSTVFEWAIVRGAAGSETNTLEDVAEISGGLPLPVWSDSDYSMPPLDGDTIMTVLPTAITISAVGLIESLMTVRLVDEITQTKGDAHRESIMLGVGNFITAFFGGQGGCSEIGLTMINLKSGGRTRVAAWFSSLIVLLVIVAASPVINLIPVAGLVGVMFVVVIHTFEWSSPKMLATTVLPQTWREHEKVNSFQKIQRSDALVVVVVTIVTPFTDLAIAVACGCAIALLAFAWQSGDNIHAPSSFRKGLLKDDPPVIKVYEVSGPLFYASVERFLSLFDHHNDPEMVELHFQTADIFDYSALQAINTLGERYKNAGKRMRLRRIKEESLKVVQKANDLMLEEIHLVLDDSTVEPDLPHHLNIEGFDDQMRRRSEQHVREMRQRSHSNGGDEHGHGAAAVANA